MTQNLIKLDKPLSDYLGEQSYAEKKYASIPDELKTYNQWVLWTYSETQNGKLTKIPLSVNGNFANVTNPDTWASYADILQAFESRVGQGCDGIGFVLTKKDPFVFIDLDQTDNPEHMDLQQKVCSEFEDSYSEKSPSGQGLHIIARGEIPTGKRRYSCEIYDCDRYMTMTGDVFNAKPVIEKQDKISSLWEYLKGDTSDNGITPSTDEAEKYTDQEIFDKAAGAVNAEKFLDLWNGNWIKYYGSQSEADQALINIIAFYSRNDEQVTRMFLASMLGKREKANRKDYMQRMIVKSRDNNTIPVNFELFKSMMAQKFDLLKENVDWDEVETYGTDCPPKPPGLIGDVMDYVYGAAPLPVPLYALVSALGLMAGICGKAYNVDGAGLNLYMLALGTTGTGKDSINSGINNLSRVIREANPTLFNFIGPGTISSFAALSKHLADNPCCVSVLGEFGVTFGTMVGGRASEHMTSLKKAILEVFNRSGKNEEVTPVVYSDKANNVKTLRAPAYSIVGESVPERFWENVTQDLVGDGFIPRFLILEYAGPRVYHNYERVTIPSNRLVGNLVDLASECNKNINTGMVKNIPFTEEARAALKLYEKNNTDLMNSLPKSDFSKELWNRSGINITKLAGLVAVGINPYEPIIDINCFNWARNIVVQSVENVRRRFRNGDTGIESFEDKQVMECHRYIRRYLEMDQDTIRKNNLNSLMVSDKVVPFAYLQTRLSQLAPFKKDKQGPTSAMNRCLKVMIDSGLIQELPKTRTYERYQHHQRSFMVVDPEALLQIGKNTAGRNKKGRK
jgi:hypothetical protein